MMFNGLHILSVELLVLYYCIVHKTSMCFATSPESRSSFFEGHEGFKLVGHVMETRSTDAFGCGMRCLGNENCRSYNSKSDGNHGNMACELSDQTRLSSPDNLRRDPGFTYFEKLVKGGHPSHPGHSCKDILDSGDSTGDGEYWIDPERNGNLLKVYCDMTTDGDGCRKRRLYRLTSDLDLEKNLILGQGSTKPGNSCKHILESGSSLGDGEYWIDPGNNGKPFKGYCDIKTDGGGWLLVANIVADSSASFFDDWALETSHHQISEYGNNNLRLAQSGLKALRTQLNFTQLRFHCKKQSGRRFHVTTAPNNTGEAVVQYFSGQTDVMPDSCGSFQRMYDDNSFLSVNCLLWGKDDGNHRVGKWGHYNKTKQNRMYDRAAFVALQSLWLIGPNNQLCDDKKNDMTLSPGDFWKVYVR